MKKIWIPLFLFGKLKRFVKTHLVFVSDKKYYQEHKSMFEEIKLIIIKDISERKTK